MRHREPSTFQKTNKPLPRDSKPPSNGAGTLVRTMGREGEGPGEIKGALEIEVIPEGEIRAMDTGNVRITRWGPSWDSLPWWTQGVGGRPRALVQRSPALQLEHVGPLGRDRVP